MLATLVADVTDTPVWFLFGATVALAVVTAGLAGAAIYALRQLSEGRTDRHVQVLADFGRRWDELRASRELDLKYTPEELMEIPRKLELHPVDLSLQKEWLSLTRIANFFEDLGLIVKSGGIDLKLVARGFKDLVLDEWRHWEPVIDSYKDTYPYWYWEFRQLAQDMKALPDPEESDRP